MLVETTNFEEQIRRTKHWTEVLDRRALTWQHSLLALGQLGRSVGRASCCDGGLAATSILRQSCCNGLVTNSSKRSMSCRFRSVSVGPGHSIQNAVRRDRS